MCWNINVDQRHKQLDYCCFTHPYLPTFKHPFPPPFFPFLLLINPLCHTTTPHSPQEPAAFRLFKAQERKEYGDRNLVDIKGTREEEEEEEERALGFCFGVFDEMIFYLGWVMATCWEGIHSKYRPTSFQIYAKTSFTVFYFGLSFRYQQSLLLFSIFILFGNLLISFAPPKLFSFVIHSLLFISAIWW